MPSPVSENQKKLNNGYLHNVPATVETTTPHKNCFDGNGQVDEALLGETDQQQIVMGGGVAGAGDNSKTTIVHFGPGPCTRTSIQRTNLISQDPKLRNRLFVIAAALIVLGAAIGALTLYFARFHVCTAGEWFEFINKWKYRTIRGCGLPFPY